MKRSEMVQLIAEHTMIHPFFADKLLSAIEAQGMLPPKATILWVEKHEGFGGTSEIEANVWEPEGEK